MPKNPEADPLNSKTLFPGQKLLSEEGTVRPNNYLELQMHSAEKILGQPHMTKT